MRRSKDSALLQRLSFDDDRLAEARQRQQRRARGADQWQRARTAHDRRLRKLELRQQEEALKKSRQRSAAAQGGRKTESHADLRPPAAEVKVPVFLVNARTDTSTHCPTAAPS